MRERTNQTIVNLRRNGFDVKYFEDVESAKKNILDDIKAAQSVGFGGSVTVDSLGIYESLQKKGHAVFWHWKADNKDERKNSLHQSCSTDIYLTGCNAITESGSLVNIDATGNRLAGMLYGHKQVFVVVGTNKIVGNYEEALLRIKNQACPLNAKRLGLNTPCAESGKCMNCDSPQRICKATLIIDKQPGGVPITIYLINESLGY